MCGGLGAARWSSSYGPNESPLCEIGCAFSGWNVLLYRALEITLASLVRFSFWRAPRPCHDTDKKRTYRIWTNRDLSRDTSSSNQVFGFTRRTSPNVIQSLEQYSSGCQTDTCKTANQYAYQETGAVILLAYALLKLFRGIHWKRTAT